MVFGRDAFRVAFSFFKKVVRRTIVVVIVVVVVRIVVGVVLVAALTVVLIVGVIVFFVWVVGITAARALAVFPKDSLRRHRGHRPVLVWDAYLGALGDILSSPHKHTIRDLLIISPVRIISSVVTGVVEQAKTRE